MKIKCPNCSHPVEMESQPVRGPAHDRTEVWLCLKCPQIVCANPVKFGNDQSIPCYVKHTTNIHSGQQNNLESGLRDGLKNKHKK